MKGEDEKLQLSVEFKTAANDKRELHEFIRDQLCGCGVRESIDLMELSRRVKNGIESTEVPMILLFYCQLFPPVSLGSR